MQVNNLVMRNIFTFLFLIFSAFIAVAEDENKYLLSSESYQVLNDVRGLMDKKDFKTAESRLGVLLQKKLGEYDKAVVYQTMGYLYLSLNEYDKAANAFISSIKNGSLPPDITHDINYKIAQLLVQAGKYQESLQYLTTWFNNEQSPQPVAHMLIASVYYQLKEYHKMVTHIQYAINKSSDANKLWYEMLLAGYYQIDEYKNAADLLVKMIKIFPDTTNYWLQLAATYYKEKDYKKALAVYKLAYTKNLLKEDEIIRLAQIYLNENLPYQAGEILEENINQGKINRTRENLKLLADSWLLAREDDKALSALQELAKNDNNPNTFFRIGQIYFEQEQWQETISLLDRILKDERLEKKAEAYLLLGIAAYHVSETDLSANALKKAVSFESTRRQAEWWLNKLENKTSVNAG